MTDEVPTPAPESDAPAPAVASYDDPGENTQPLPDTIAHQPAAGGFPDPSGRGLVVPPLNEPVVETVTSDPEAPPNSPQGDTNFTVKNEASSPAQDAATKVRRQRNDLDDEVYDAVCAVLEEAGGNPLDKPLTPSRISARIKDMKGLEKAPSGGAINNVLDRWAAANIAVVNPSPKAFVEFTPEAQARGVTAMREEFKASNKAMRDAAKAAAAPAAAPTPPPPAQVAATPQEADANGTVPPSEPVVTALPSTPEVQPDQAVQGPNSVGEVDPSTSVAPANVPDANVEPTTVSELPVESDPQGGADGTNVGPQQ